ncbi:MAG: hypothetical protein J3Q66DRAFT_350669 [Benniella sp.]|nr:MAG: hypothetical protein J3Q66DRAFT_350669 [Benniella sp.]
MKMGGWACVRARKASRPMGAHVEFHSPSDSIRFSSYIRVQFRRRRRCGPVFFSLNGIPLRAAHFFFFSAATMFSLERPFSTDMILHGGLPSVFFFVPSSRANVLSSSLRRPPPPSPSSSHFSVANCIASSSLPVSLPFVFGWLLK